MPPCPFFVLSFTGLNVEQRKRVTIGVELAARPELLLFLDEPTSGLDSDTALSICLLLRKLADEGSQILCTIHQPSKTLFQVFDKLLLLKEGQTAYFGDIGHQGTKVIQYFESRGASAPPNKQNPADWLLETINNDAGKVDWPHLWKESSECRAMQTSIAKLKKALKQSEPSAMRKLQYATTFWIQLQYATSRLFSHFWRSPTYLWSKLALCIGSVRKIPLLSSRY
jgi:ABC-type multidrug transport system ATPase subunit